MRSFHNSAVAVTITLAALSAFISSFLLGLLADFFILQVE